jgi:hypothetical protein
LFSFSSSNVRQVYSVVVIVKKSHCFDSNTDELKTYMKAFMMSRAKDSDIDLLLQYYPDDQRAGSPFDTGDRNIFSTFSCTSRPY